MARPKGSKNKSEVENVSDNPSCDESIYNTGNGITPEPRGIIEIIENGKTETVSEPETISFFEAAERLRTSEATIKVWIDHGHLTGSNGRVYTRSIRECRFNTRRMI